MKNRLYQTKWDELSRSGRRACSRVNQPAAALLAQRAEEYM
jgi:hypothetical protein